ncbi:NIPSNAP family protein [Amphritea sp. 2_MG-2023]|jgi:hypothetical protein|uniref:NIPSNAP family protein n=1 Tax=Amphritea TaxID=515417 RepID=UPI001C075990|nr:MULTISPECIES: NIPSNAP family protein [Amphritea]MBU2966753.1 NIPSNAP family protein [Amphritea atlantica]MDO6418980.1 NIPSNAP family protein [Amphritea sp. 2_MG-2023]MDX2423552.1 NIPSNAP family protein [Amphritea sp.]
MFVDERIYTLKNGKLGEFLKLYETLGKDVQVRILGNMVGYFHTDIGPLNQVVHMWGYESLDDRYQRRLELQASEEWLKYALQMRPLVQSIENKILIPESWSPIGGTGS